VNEAVGKAQDLEKSDHLLRGKQPSVMGGVDSPEGKERNDMKMLTIVCNEKIEDEVLVLFSDLGIKGYTVIAGAGGSGDTGAVSVKFGGTGRNMLFLVGLDDAQMATLVTAVKEVHARLVEEHHGHEVPLKAFLQHCEVIL
jgi:nitrogen regulatory protein P-II